jgi:signal transduction histidine kinase
MDEQREGRENAQRRSTARWFFTVFLTLRGRLILLVCFATVPAILFIFIVAERERESTLLRMETEARHLGSLASREHAHQINGGKRLLRRLGDGIECDGLTSATEQTCPGYLPALLSGLPQFANIGVASAHGEILCSAAHIQHAASLRTNTAFERALESADVEVGTYAVGFVGRPVLHMAYAARSDSQPPCAVAFVALELGWLDDLAHQANLPADYSLLITDRTGHVLARSGAALPDFIAEIGRTDPTLAEAIHRPRGAVVQIGSPPTTRYFVATPMDGIEGFFVVAGLPYERVQGTANRVFQRTLIGLILVTILAIASAIFAAELSVLRVLRALTRAVRRFGAGDLSARAPIPGSHGELRELAVSFRNMADALTARQKEAREAQEGLRALSHRLQVVRDEEAGRIARELHDELGQVLTGLKMELVRVRRVYAGSAQSPAGEQVIAEMSDQIDGAIDAVRRLSSELRPPVLDRLGLASAIDWLVHDCEAKSGISVVLHVDLEERTIDSLVSTTVFRIIQEALTNVVRHAGATEVSIDLIETADSLHLSICDNGKGLDRAAAEGPRSLGILGMEERARLLGGTFQIEGAPGRGTTITADVPLIQPGAKPTEMEKRA